MCYATSCSKCGKTTWSGCGMHAVAVMASVKQENRCMCDSAKAATAGYSIVPPK
eukprot:gene5385-gene5991